MRNCVHVFHDAEGAEAELTTVTQIERFGIQMRNYRKFCPGAQIPNWPNGQL